MIQSKTWLAFAERGREHEPAMVVSIAPGIDAFALWTATANFIPGWSVYETGPRRDVDISISGTDTDLTLKPESWDGRSAKAGRIHEAGNLLTGLLIDGLLARGRAAFCLHAAASEIGGQAVLFLGPGHAGKSTMALRLAARGCRHLSDDRILLLSAEPPYRVAALGLIPKIRKPLPPGEELARMHEAHWFIDTDDGAHLLLDEGATGERVANFGDEFSLGAIVLPRRNPSQPGVVLRPAKAVEAARVLIEEATSAKGSGAIVPAMTRLAEDVDTYILEYDEGAAAADELLKALSKS